MKCGTRNPHGLLRGSDTQPFEDTIITVFLSVQADMLALAISLYILES